MSMQHEVTSDGKVIPMGAYDQALFYNSDGTLSYVQVVTPDGTYRQTYGYVSGVVTSISRWTKQ